MKSIFTLLLVFLSCFVQRASATDRVFEFRGTITTSNMGEFPVGTPFVATLRFDDAQTGIPAGSQTYYDNFSFTLRLTGLDFTTNPATDVLFVEDDTRDQLIYYSKQGCGTFIDLTLINLAGTVFNPTSLPSSLSIADFDNANIRYNVDPCNTGSRWNGTITSITPCVADPIVTTNADAGPGSLRQAMIDACPGSTITFDPSLNGSTIVLENELPVEDKNLTINGPGADKLTISGNDAVRIFSLTSINSFSISGLTLANGRNAGNIGGGAIYQVHSSVYVTNVSFVNNSAGAGAGGAVYAYGDGQIAVNGSTFTGNAALNPVTGKGGAVYAETYCTIVNSTFYANSSAISGGAIHLGSSGNLTNCTVSGNSVVGPNSDYGGIYAGYKNSLTNCIVAGNTSPGYHPDVAGFLIFCTYNIIGINNDIVHGVDGNEKNQLGTSSNPINPLLGPLASNGGTTLTMALSPGSPAVNAGTFNNTPHNDQRGFGRKFDFDIGAYELQSATTVTTVTSSPSPSCIGSPVIITATVTSDGYPVTSGTVYLFKDNLTATIAEVNSAGQISYSTASLIEGTHTITAEFKGSTIFGESTGYGTHTVSPLPTANITGTSTCAGTATTLTASSAASNPSFIWSEIPIGGGGGAGKVLSTNASYTTDILSSNTSYNLKITDGTTHCSSTSVVDVAVNPLPVISPASLPPGLVGVPYSQNITASGGTGSSVIGLLSGMPPGLTLTSSGLLSGTPATTGTYLLNVYAKDTKGCTATMQYSITISPSCVITCPANITVNNKTGLCGAYVSYPAATTTGTCGTLTYSIKSGSWFAVGTTTVTVTSTTGSICTFNVIVKDVQKPTIVCPSDITVNASSNSCSKAVTFNLTVTDNCPGATITTSPASGSAFNAGTTTVTATATDASGNKSTSTFTVKVKESQPPVIKTIATPIVLAWPANGSYQTITVSQFVNSVSDNCSSIPVSTVKITKVTSDESENASGDADGNTTKDIKIASDCKSVDLRRERKSTGNGRVYTIYLSVTDASGNSGTASSKVIAPVSQTGTTAVCDATGYAVNSNCSGNSYRSADGTTAEDVIVKNDIPEGFMMEQNYPNPFYGVTIIRYTLPAEAQVSLGVYNQLGQRVTQLTEGRMSAGYHQARFDASKLAAGIYLYRLLAVDADGKPVVINKKMIVAK